MFLLVWKTFSAGTVLPSALSHATQSVMVLKQQVLPVAEHDTFSFEQSPDVNPIMCPPDAFCPAGSTQPQYCMETFLQKAGDSCELAPLTIVLLAILSAGK